MANAEKIPPESMPIPAKKGGSKLVVILLGLILLVVLGLGGYMFMSLRALQSKVTPDAHAEETKPKAAELFAPLDPAFVVNFQDDDLSRYLQVGVTVMTHDPAVLPVLKENDPVIRNALVMLFSSQTVQDLSSTAGKQKLQAQALAAVRKIVQDKTGKPGVDALYFTSFVMQ